MVDYFALALTHGLLVLAGWRLLWRDDLDRDPDPATDGESEADEQSPTAKAGLKATGPELRIRA